MNSINYQAFSLKQSGKTFIKVSVADKIVSTDIWAVLASERQCSGGWSEAWVEYAMTRAVGLHCRAQSLPLRSRSITVIHHYKAS